MGELLVYMDSALTGPSSAGRAWAGGFAGAHAQEQGQAPAPGPAGSRIRLLGGFVDWNLAKRFHGKPCSFESPEVFLKRTVAARKRHRHLPPLDAIDVLIGLQVRTSNHKGRIRVEAFELARRVDGVNARPASVPARFEHSGHLIAGVRRPPFVRKRPWASDHSCAFCRIGGWARARSC